VTSAVSDSAASVCLSTLAVLLRLTTESTLVNLALSGSAEWHAVRFEFSDSEGCLTSHVLHSVLISKPISTLYSIVEMPSPVILVHVTESCINTTLSGNSERSSREQLRDASGLETSLGQTESSSETGTTSSDDDGIILMINDGVVTDAALALESIVFLAGRAERSVEGSLDSKEGVEGLVGSSEGEV